MTHSQSRLLSRLLAILLAVGLAVSAFADSGLARHKKMYAVPATKKVTIDGKLTDWDLSGQISMYVVSETADMMSAKFALMYDKDALYLSAEVRDPTPMMNRHDPTVDANKGWDADACQFRLSLDPKIGYPVSAGYGDGGAASKTLVHMTLWNYTDKQQPCLQMHSSMQYVPARPEWAPHGMVPSNLYQAKYLKQPDGRGYTFEYRIPWSTLGAKNPLTAGDLVAGTVQFNWSKPDGLTTNGGWAYDVMTGPGFTFQTSAVWGKLIFSDKGNLPKAMVEEGVAPAKPLPLKFNYELPQDSQITIQLMDKNNMVRRILVPQGDRRGGKNVELWDGMDDQGNPLPAGDYTWKGIYHQPITTKFLFSPNNTGTPPYSTDDGTGGWGGDHGEPQDACAFNEGVILCWDYAEAGWGIIRTDLNGKKLWGNRINSAVVLATDGKRVFFAGDQGANQNGGVKMLDIADSRPINFGNGSPMTAAPAGGDAKSNVVTGIACADGNLYIAYGVRNLVGVFDAQSGNEKALWKVPTPGRITARPGGGLAVISGNTILTVKNGTVTKLADTHLEQPQGLTSGADGLLYVTNAGALQNISVFDANGQYLRSIGMAGGRPAKGRYNPNGILEPGGITLDKNNHLWVAERLDSPKRVSEWDANTGALVNEFFGSCAYFGYSYIDPTHPDEIYCHNTLWKIDWKNNNCAPYSTIWRAAAPNMMWPIGVGGYIEHPVFFTAKNGKQYEYGTWGPFISVVSVRDGDLYKPFAAFFNIMRGHFNDDFVKACPLLADEKKYPDANYYWQDQNNDQTLQEDEIIPAPAVYRSAGFNFLDGDLNAQAVNGQLRPTRIDADGHVYYDVAKLEETPMSKTMHGVGIIPDTTNGGFFNYEKYRASENWYSKWSSDGKLLWAYPGMIDWPYRLNWPMQAPGRLYGLTNYLGVAGNFTGLSCYFGTYHLFTLDGIYVGMLMRDGRDGKGLGPNITNSEVLTGQLVKLDNLPDSAGKSRYFLLAGAADARVTEIFGLDTIKPLPGGAYTLTEADAKTAVTALADYNVQLQKGKRLFIARGQKGLANAEPVTKMFDADRKFTARAAYDAQNLYVSFDVTTPNDLINSQPDPSILFKGGNCLDIQLAADQAADEKRKTPTPGDVRLLVTRQNGKPFAVIYRPKVKAFTGQPTVLTSPTGKESFDAIAVSDAIALDYQKTAAGYQATVTIPLATIGLALQPGQQVKMDLGVLYGNTTGTQCAARSYWMNNSFSANITYDIPNESRLEPAEWGMAAVE